jgi:hypothetical protein
VDGDDVWVLERGEHPCVTRVVSERLTTVGIRRTENLDRHFLSGTAIARDVDRHALVPAELAQ